jgi:hypothetical protein
MPAKATKNRGTGAKKAKETITATNCVWTILEDASFWTISMDDQGGYTTVVHGVVCSQATASINFVCPSTLKKVSILTFDVCGIHNNIGETHAVRVLPTEAEKIISWATDAVTSCHEVINDLWEASEKNLSLSKSKGTCQCNESPNLPSRVCSAFLLSHLRAFVVVPLLVVFVVVAGACVIINAEACVNINAGLLSVCDERCMTEYNMPAVCVE